MMKPIAIVTKNPKMNGLRFPTLSEQYAMNTASIAAVMYIGTVISCAASRVYPRSLMMVGKKSEIPYSGQTICKCLA